MKKIIIIFTIAFFLTVSACIKKPEKAASIEVINGITHVHNTAQPLYPQRTITFSQDLSIGGKDYNMYSALRYSL